MVGLTGDACLPPSTQNLHTTMTQKSPKKRDQIAADIGHGGTDASVAVGHVTTDAFIPAASKSRYPSRRLPMLEVLLPILSPRMLILTLSSIQIWLTLLPRIHCK